MPSVFEWVSLVRGHTGCFNKLVGFKKSDCVQFFFVESNGHEFGFVKWQFWAVRHGMHGRVVGKFQRFILI